MADQRRQDQRNAANRKKEKVKTGRVKKGTLSLKPLKKRALMYGFGLGMCAICLDEMGMNTKLVAETKCGHMYCLHCIQKILQNRKQCPTCRGMLYGPKKIQALYIVPVEEIPDGETKPKDPEKASQDVKNKPEGTRTAQKAPEAGQVGQK